ncbi:NEW3 domain-containing protein [Aromatoleum petrolei]|nr:NEW3 domain-containing protein [Aromatoleum petrolei]
MFLWLLLLCWTEVFAQAGGLRVRAVDYELASFEPRGVVTLAFEVANDSARPQDLEPTLELPAGWRAVTPDAPFTLAPGESTVRFVTFVIPEGTSATDYAVRYTARNRRQPEVSAHHAVNIRVNAVRRLEAAALDVPDAVVSGQPYRAVFVVRNAGNAPVVVNFQARSSLGHPVDPAQGRLELAPRESREVALEVRTEALARPGFDQLTLTVSADTELSTQSMRVVKLLPLGGGGEGLYRTIPGRVKLSFLSRDEDGKRAGGWQTELTSAGAVDEAGAHRINILLRGPDARQASALGAWDEYRFEYSGKGVAAGVGDLTYGLTPLTEYGRYGRGAQAKVMSDDWGFELYEMGDRFTRTENRQLGVSASRAVSPASRLSLNYLAKSGEREANIYSLRAVRQEAAFSAETELASSDGATPDRAVRGYLFDSRGGLRYSATALYAGPRFAGYYRDQALVSVSGHYPLGEDWGLRASVLWQRMNLERIATRPALEESQLSLGLEFPLAAGINSSADLLLRRKRDLRRDPNVDLLHPSVRLNGAYGAGNWGLSASGEFGTTEDCLSDRRYATSLALLSLYLNPSERHFYNLYLIRDDNTYSAVRQRVNTSAGAGASFQLWERARLQLNLQRSVAENANRFFMLGFEQTLRGGQTISLLLRSTSGRFAHQTDAQFSVSFPFDVPIVRRADVAPVAGRLLDAETGAGLKDVPLSLDGAIVMTDEQGYFRYDAARAGRRYLTLAGAGGAAGKVPLTPFPREMEVRTDGDNYQEIQFVVPGSVKGQIRRYEPVVEMPSQAYRRGGNDADPMAEGDGVPGALVMVRRGELEYRRLADAEGRFRIDGLPPGKWLVSVDEGSLPPGSQYQAEQLQFQLDVRSGEETPVDFRLLPRTRRMRMIPNVSALNAP